MNEVLRETENHMSAAVENFKGELSRLRTGRASLSLLDGITVEQCGPNSGSLRELEGETVTQSVS